MRKGYFSKWKPGLRCEPGVLIGPGRETQYTAHCRLKGVPCGRSTAETGGPTQLPHLSQLCRFIPTSELAVGWLRLCCSWITPLLPPLPISAFFTSPQLSFREHFPVNLLHASPPRVSFPGNYPATLQGGFFLKAPTPCLFLPRLQTEDLEHTHLSLTGFTGWE